MAHHLSEDEFDADDILIFLSERLFVFATVFFSKEDIHVKYIISMFFMFSNFYYLILFMKRQQFLERNTSLDSNGRITSPDDLQTAHSAIFSKRNNDWFWIERAGMILFFGGISWGWLLTSFIFICSNSMFLTSYISYYLSYKEELKGQQVQKNDHTPTHDMRIEDGAEQLENKEAEIKGNRKEEIIASNKNEAHKRSEYQEPKSVTNGSAISSCEMKDEEKKKNEESSHAAGSGSSEELKRTERGEHEESDDKEEDIAEECECHIFDHGKDIKREQVRHHINDIAVISDEYVKDLKKLLHNEELTRYRYEKQLLKKKMKKIKNEHEEQRSKWEEEKNEMAGKLSAATALSEFYQNLCRNWEEEKNVLAAKLCASTASSEFYRGLLHDSGY